MIAAVNAVPVRINGRVVMQGTVYDQDGNVIATFGPDGLDYMDWFSQLDEETQLRIVSDELVQYAVPWLLKTSGVQR